MKEKKTDGKIWEKAKAINIFQKPIKRAKNEIYKKNITIHNFSKRRF